jgi:translation initiation factor IF-1
MAKEAVIEMSGTIEECLPGAMFRVRLDTGQLVIGTLGGKLRKNNIHILLGDQVDMEFSPYDVTRGRIVYRHK